MEDIADAIRTKKSTSSQYKPVNMADEILSISGGSGPSYQLDQLSVTSNGVYTPQAGHAYDQVTVQIEESSFSLQSKTVTPSTSPQSVTPDSGFTGLSSVTVNSIPSNYADTSDLDATSSDVISGKKFVGSTGQQSLGNLTVCTYYVGESAPDSSTLQEGDLYLQI